MDLSTHENVTVTRASPATAAREPVTVDYLYLDRTDCDRCVGTGATLETALDRVAGPLADAGVTLSYRQVHVETARDARRVGLSVSPTVRVDGRDVQPAAYTAACEDCTGPGTGEAVPCRRWLHDGQLHDTPPVPLLVGGVLRGAVDASADGPTGEGRLSAALSAYFGETDGDNACC